MESDEKNKIDEVSASPPSAPREGTIYSARIEKFHRLFILYFILIYVSNRSGKEKWLFNLRLAMVDRYIESLRGGSKLIPGVGR